MAQGLLEKSLGHIKEHFAAWILLFLVFAGGLFIGFGAPQHLEAAEMSRISIFIDSLIKNIPAMKIDSLAEFRNSLFFNGGIALGIWFLGASVIGSPLAIGLLFYKGFTLGFSIALLLTNNALNGFIIILLTVVPQNIILIPAFLVATYWALSFAGSMFRKKEAGGSLFLPAFGNYSCYFLLIFAAIAAAALLQGCLGPWLLKTFLNII